MTTPDLEVWILSCILVALVFIYMKLDELLRKIWVELRQIKENIGYNYNPWHYREKGDK
jgi:hypothetical protein